MKLLNLTPLSMQLLQRGKGKEGEGEGRRDEGMGGGGKDNIQCTYVH